MPIPDYPKWAVVVDTAPRSGKHTFFVAKLDSDFEYPIYRTWARADFSTEAMERVRELNEKETL